MPSNRRQNPYHSGLSKIWPKSMKITRHLLFPLPTFNICNISPLGIVSRLCHTGTRGPDRRNFFMEHCEIEWLGSGRSLRRNIMSSLQAFFITLHKTYYHRFSFCPVAMPVVTCTDFAENEAKMDVWWFCFTSHLPIGRQALRRGGKKVRSSAQVSCLPAGRWEAVRSKNFPHSHW